MVFKMIQAALFATACPKTNKSAALVLPHANTETMTLHLAEISAQVTEGAHAVVILDQAGWHTANDLDLPDNISLNFLPPYSPELPVVLRTTPRRDAVSRFFANVKPYVKSNSETEK